MHYHAPPKPKYACGPHRHVRFPVVKQGDRYTDKLNGHLSLQAGIFLRDFLPCRKIRTIVKESDENRGLASSMRMRPKLLECQLRRERRRENSKSDSFQFKNNAMKGIPCEPAAGVSFRSSSRMGRIALRGIRSQYGVTWHSGTSCRTLCLSRGVRHTEIWSPDSVDLFVRGFLGLVWDCCGPRSQSIRHL
jgi:hypothetical protein